MSRDSLFSRRDLRPTEQRFLAAMHALGYGRFESLQIRGGELVLDPWPTSVQSVKLGTPTANQPAVGAKKFELKSEVVELFGLIRKAEHGEIRILEVRGGLPFSLEIELERQLPRKLGTDMDGHPR